jgi:hypothetical protein
MGVSLSEKRSTRSVNTVSPTTARLRNSKEKSLPNEVCISKTARISSWPTAAARLASLHEPSSAKNAVRRTGSLSTHTSKKERMVASWSVAMRCPFARAGHPCRAPVMMMA